MQIRHLQFVTFAACLIALIAAGRVTAQGWQKVRVDLGSADKTRPADLMRLGRINDAELWLLADNGVLFKSTDDGKTWADTKISPLIDATGIYFPPSGRFWVVGVSEKGKASGNSPLRFSSDGSKWENVVLPTAYGRITLHGIIFLGKDVGIAVGEAVGRRGVILRTIDGGRSWRFARVNDYSGSFFVEVMFISAKVGFAVGDGGIMQTEDAGSTWSLSWQSPDDRLSDVISMTSTPSGGIIAVGGWALILRSADRGRTWKAATGLGEGSFFRGVSCGTKSCWAVGSDSETDGAAIYRSDDDGKTWVRETVDSKETLFNVIATRTSVIAIGSNGTILRREL